MSRKNNVGIKVLIILEIIALIAVGALCAYRKANPKEDTRTINRKEAVTEQITPQDDVTSEAENVTTEHQVDADIIVKGEDNISQDIKDKVAKMSVEEKASLLFVVSPERLTGEREVILAGNVTRQALETYHIGGLSYSNGNYRDDEQIGNLIADTKDMTREILGYEPILFARDEANSKDIIYASGADSTALCNSLSTADGVENVADDSNIRKISCHPDNAFIPSAEIIMVTTDTIDTIDEEHPVCLSEKAITNYRNENSYYGIIMTEKFDTEAIIGSLSSADSAVMAINAGVDMIFEPENLEESIQGIVAAIENGDLSEDRLDEAAGRVLAYMSKLGQLEE